MNGDVMNYITIIEDNIALNNGIALALKNAGYSFSQLYKPGEYDAAEHTDIIVFDVDLPDGSGVDELEDLRERSSVPVLVLSSAGLDDEKFLGIDLREDDLITKPFSLTELRSRIDKVLGRYGGIYRSVFHDGGYVFDFDLLQFRAFGEKVELNKNEQKLLRLLVTNKDRTLTNEQLIEQIWSYGSDSVYEDELYAIVEHLRFKLDAEDKIQPVYGIGYIWRTR